MEPSVFTIKIDKEIKFKKSDLEQLKDSEFANLDSNDTKICKFLNVVYYLNINPNGCGKEKHGQTWLFFHVKVGGALKVESNIKCCVESANASINVKYVFDTSKGWGNKLCTTEELFDPTKKFFIIDEMIIKVKGTMKIYLPTNKIIYPFSTKWSINKKELESSKNSVDETQNYLKTEKFPCSLHTDIKYNLVFYSNGKRECNRGESTIVLQIIEFGTDVSKIEAFYNFSIVSANFSKDFESIFEKVEGHGTMVCSTKDLFNPENQYFVDDKLIFNVTGTFFMERQEPKTSNLVSQENIVMKDIQTKNEKDFTIAIGEKNIKVHKQLLNDSSPYFIGLFNSGMIESIEMKTTITDFEYEIVEAGIQILYNPSKIPSNFSFEQMFELLRFSDKYDIQSIKDLIENHCIENISSTNVCPLVNFTSTTVSAPKLYSKCIEYIVKCSEEKKVVYGLETLDKDLITHLFMQSFTKNFST